MKIAHIITGLGDGEDEQPQVVRQGQFCKAQPQQLAHRVAEAAGPTGTGK